MNISGRKEWSKMNTKFKSLNFKNFIDVKSCSMITKAHCID